MLKSSVTWWKQRLSGKCGFSKAPRWSVFSLRRKRKEREHLKGINRGWRDGSVFQGAYHSSRVPEPSSQNPYRAVPNSLKLQSQEIWYPLPSSDPLGNRHIPSTHTLKIKSWKATDWNWSWGIALWQSAFMACTSVWVWFPAWQKECFKYTHTHMPAASFRRGKSLNRL